MRSLLALLLTLGLVLAPRAYAQDAGADSRAHFARGVRLYDEGRLPQALAEFREAQHTSPSSVVLYNIAQVEAELGHAVQAVDAYEELVASARTIEPAMRSQIDEALAEQRSRIATLRVVTNALGALIAVDDVDIGAAPLDDVRVSAGEHVVSARANGYESVRYRFIVAGGAVHAANLTLTLSGAAIGSLRVDSRVPGVEVLIDSVSYGLTPLASAVALPSGSHHLEGRRAAYSLFSQEVTVAPGSESRASVVVEADPAAPQSELGTLRLSIPPTSTSLRIDGAPADTSSAQHLALPAGLHDLEVHVADREPYTRRVDLLAQQTYDLRPSYAWTPEARESRVRAAHGQAETGWGLIIGGGIAAVGAAIALVAVWADYEGGSARTHRAFTDNCNDYRTMWPGRAPGYAYATTCMQALQGLYTFPPGMMGRPPDQSSLDPLAAAFPRWLDTYYLEIGIGAAVAAIGGIALIAGIVLVSSAPSDADVDRSARASAFRLELTGGPSSVTLRGVF